MLVRIVLANAPRDNRAMPWCPDCERFLAPPSVTPEGRCPECSRRSNRAGPGSRSEIRRPSPPRTEAPEELAPVPCI